MPLTLNGTTGIAGVDGSAGTPASKGSDTDTGIVYGTNTVQIATNGTAQATVDASGNLGLGVTPSAWQSGRRAFQINGSTGGGVSVHSAAISQAVFGANNYYDGANYVYSSTGYATLYQQLNGTHFWNIAASGTAGSAISFTQAMTLDSSGNLLVGTTGVTGYRFVVQGATADGTTYSVLMRNSSSTELLSIKNDGGFFTGVASFSPYNYTTASAANTFVGSNGVLQRSTSSLRYKTDIHDATHGLSDVLNLRSVTYKGINDGNKVFGGLIAEEVDAAGLSEFVVYDGEGRPDALHYGNMAGLFVKAIQELSAKLEAAEARIATLEAK